MLLRNIRPEPTNAEDGYLLLTVLVMIFLMLLALSVAAPRVAKQIQRDKEQEAVQRGLQYKRAIQLYYKKFGAYPTDLKQLENTNQIRFLRKRYTDPITGKDDWRLIHMGEAKVPPMGFFGQPLQAGMSSASTGPGLGAGSAGTPGLYANSDTSGTTGSGNGSGNASENGTQGTSGGTAGGGSSSFGFSNNNSSNMNSPGGAGSTGFGFNNSTTPSTGGIGTTPTGTNGPGASNTSGGSTFGGGPIVGIGIPVKKDSVIEYHKQKKYSDWEFVYDPQEELLMNSGGIASGGNVNGAGANGNAAGMGTNGSNGSNGSSSFGFSNSGSNGSSGSGFGNSGSGGSSGSGFGNFGSSPSSGPGGSSPPSTPTSPQQ